MKAIFRCMVLLLATACAGRADAALSQQRVYGMYHWMSGADVAESKSSLFNGGQVVTPTHDTCSIVATLPDGQKGLSWYCLTNASSPAAHILVSSLTWYDTYTGSLLWEKDDAYGTPVYFGLECDWISYTLRYASEGSGVSLPDQMNEIVYTNEFQLADAPSRTGYDFVAWTNAANAAQSFEAGATVTGSSFALTNHDDSAIVTLVAKWTAHSHRVEYALAGGQAGASQPTTATYDSWFVVSDPTRTGYEFQEWSVSGQKGTAASVRRHAAEKTTEYLNLTPDQDGTVTLTAVWKPCTYEVTFNNHGASSGESGASVTYDAAYKAVNVPSREGSSFAGYYTEAEGQGDCYWTNEGQPTRAAWDIPSNVTMHAAWSTSSVWIEYDANGGVGEIEPQLVTYGATVTLSDGTCKDGSVLHLSGNNLLGWSESKTSSTPQYGLGAKQSFTKATKLYAVWQMYYSVAFKANGGEGEMPVETFYYDQTRTLPKNQFTRTGYAFGGWATNEASAAAHRVEYADGEIIAVPMTLVPGSTNELWAVWQTNAYYVAFDPGQGGGDAMPVQRFVYDQTQALSRCTFAAPGSLMTFDRWALVRGSQTNYYADCEIVSNLTATANATNVLTALWKPDVGEWSEALHCTSLRWTIHNDGGSPEWTRSQTGGVAGDSCCRQEGSGARSTKQWLAAEVTESGTLTFSVRWDRSVGETSGLRVGVSSMAGVLSDGDVVSANCSTDWQTFTLPVQVSESASSVFIHLLSWDSKYSEAVLSIDRVTWTPTPVYADEDTDIVGFEVGDTSLACSFDSLGATYHLLGTNDLVAPMPWPIVSVTNGVLGRIRLCAPIRADASRMFYRIREVK